MPCCKADNYKWCKDLASYKIDDKYYCIFHAPNGKNKLLMAGLNDEGFNETVFRRIIDAIDKGIECDLSGTIFVGDITFGNLSGKTDLPKINLSSAIFSGKTLFNSVKFSGYAMFVDAVFKGDAYFNGAKFEETHFDRAVFERETFFTYTIFNKKIDFRSTTFIESAYFYGQTFKEEGILQEITIREKLIFEYTNLEKVSFLNTDVRNIDFINCKFPKIGWRNVLYDEICILKMEEGLFFELMHEKVSEKDIIKKVEILYRRLKQKYKEEHNEPEVSNWHYGEKEMQRRRTGFKEFFPYLFLNLYYISSGYGEDPRKALSFLIFLILAVFLTLAVCGLSPVDTVNPPYGITGNVSLSSLTDFNVLKVLFIDTLKNLTFQKDYFLEPSTLWGELVKTIAQILIPLQAAFFTLAIRNRFRR